VTAASNLGARGTFLLTGLWFVGAMPTPSAEKSDTTLPPPAPTPIHPQTQPPIHQRNHPRKKKDLGSGCNKPVPVKDPWAAGQCCCPNLFLSFHPNPTGDCKDVDIMQFSHQNSTSTTSSVVHSKITAPLPNVHAVWSSWPGYSQQEWGEVPQKLAQLSKCYTHVTG